MILIHQPGIHFETPDVGDGPGLGRLGKRCVTCGCPTCSGADCCCTCSAAKGGVPDDAEINPLVFRWQVKSHYQAVVMREDEFSPPRTTGRRFRIVMNNRRRKQ